MSAADQRSFGHDCAHEDIRGQMEPCVSIEDARRRIASMYAGDNVSAEDIEACAQGYLAGWASALPAKGVAFAQWLRDRADAVVNDDPDAAATLYLAASQAPAGIVAPAWGPFPTAAEVTAHVAAHPPLRWASPWATGAPWLRLSGNGDLSVIYLAIVDGVVRARFGGLPEWHELEFGRAGMWRPITAQGEATDERDATIAILETHAAHDATAIAQNVADIRDTRAQVAALTDERDEAQAQLRGAKATIAELLRAADEEKATREARWSAHLADVERLMAERDAAFTRGVEAMREAAAKVAAECASERGHTQAAMFAASRPDDAFVVGIKGGEASRIEGLIRALKVAP